MQRFAFLLVPLAFAGCMAPTVIVCESSRDCSASGLVCDTSRRVCVQCLSDTDCLVEGQACLGQLCRTVTPCESSRECPGQVCDPARGYCVDCITEVDCPDGTICRDAVCVTPPRPCESDRQCSDIGQVCDMEAGVCVQCVSDVDCREGLHCAADRTCRASECTPGAVECVDTNATQRCNDAGMWEVRAFCPEGQVCTGGVCGGICDPACPVGEACVGGVCRCGSEPACALAERCVDGSCVSGCAACNPGELCLGDICLCGGGPGCAAGESCVDGLCVGAACSPDCTGEETCVDAVCRCGGNPRCAAGRVCAGGACVPTSCEPACAIGETCADGACFCGAGPACSGDEVCAGGTCVSTSCVPSCELGENCVEGECRCGAGASCLGDETCVGGSCRCGAGPACTAGQTCIGGSCSSACSESPCRVVSPQCGCGTQACDVDLDTGDRICRDIGTRTVGQTCDETNRCAAGLSCLNSYGLMVCVRFCESEAQCAGGEGAHCALVLNDGSGTTVPDVELCSTACNPLSGAGCGTGSTCYVAGAMPGTSAAVTVCRLMEAGLPFLCTETTCGVGEECVAGGTLGMACRSYCRVGVASDCFATEVCTPLDGMPRYGGSVIGLCQPITP